MCTISMVIDKFAPQFPWFDPNTPYRPTTTSPQIPEPSPFPFQPVVPWTPPLPIAELRALIDEFKKAIEAAKVVDKVLGKEDCVDPEKAKLLARVNGLERQMAAMAKGEKRARKSKRKTGGRRV